VKDLWWRLRECKERVPSSAEGALALFDYGLEITLPSASGAVTLEEKEIALHRLLFLLFKERLAIYCSLVGDRYQGDEFLEFRSRNLSNVCVTLIENGELERAQLLLDGSNDVAANLLHILANVSELLDPKQYRALLPDTAFLNNRVAPAIKSSADPVVAPASIASLGLPSSSISNVLARLAQLHFHKVEFASWALLRSGFPFYSSPFCNRFAVLSQAHSMTFILAHWSSRNAGSTQRTPTSASSRSLSNQTLTLLSILRRLLWMTLANGIMSAPKTLSRDQECSRMPSSSPRWAWQGLELTPSSTRSWMTSRLTTLPSTV